MTARLSRNNTACECAKLGHRCLKELKPVQGWALYEAGIAGGLLGAIGVGSGKTILDILAPLVVKDCRLAVLLVPPNLVAQLMREYKALSQHFRVPSIVFKEQGSIVPGTPVLHVMPYSLFSRAQSTELLETLKPDLIIADECHKLKHKNSATTSRVLRYFSAHPTTRLCAWSGTITTKSIKDYAHLLKFALRESSPLPLDYNVLEEWSLAIDPNDWPAPEGSLKVLMSQGETVQQGYYRRLVETRGVVATKGGSVDASIIINERQAPPMPAQVKTALKDLRQTWTRPDGEELVSALDVSRVAHELACGFYYRWIYPRKESAKVIDEWFRVRGLWNKELREKLKHRLPHLDSPLLCTNAAQRAHDKYKGPLPVWQSEYFEEWQAVKETVQPETEAVWLSDFLVLDSAKFGTHSRGIVWFDHAAFGHEVSRVSGLPYHGGGPKAEQAILAERGDRSLVVSIHAHGVGRDGLQRHFDTQLVTSPPSSGGVWEQLLGRLHRQGQESDEVTTEVYRHTEEVRSSVDSALLQARYIEDTLGTYQKLLLATIGWE